jgi:rhamnogalacturonyl hydrolase YesR
LFLTPPSSRPLSIHVSTIAIEAARLVRARFVRGLDATARIAYCHDMVVAALSEWELADPGGGWIEVALEAWERGKPRRTSRHWFASAEDALARATGDRAFSEMFLAGTETMLRDVARTGEGLMVFTPSPAWNLPAERQPLLIDAMQEYASRLVSAVSLGGDASWLNLAADQFTGYARILRNPVTGLWANAFDWCKAAATVSPGAWSRGHGWLLWGLAKALHRFPLEHARRPELVGLLRDLVEALEPLRDREGMWHVLLHRGHGDSDEEVSGTALIAYGMARGIVNRDLDAARWRQVVRRAMAAVRRRIDGEGRIRGVCAPPGLLADDSDTLYRNQALVEEQPYGPPTVLLGLLGEQLSTDAR